MRRLYSPGGMGLPCIFHWIHHSTKGTALQYAGEGVTSISPNVSRDWPRPPHDPQRISGIDNGMMGILHYLMPLNPYKWKNHESVDGLHYVTHEVMQNC